MWIFDVPCVHEEQPAVRCPDCLLWLLAFAFSKGRTSIIGGDPLLPTGRNAQAVEDFVRDGANAPITSPLPDPLRVVRRAGEEHRPTQPRASTRAEACSHRTRCKCGFCERCFPHVRSGLCIS